MAKESVYNQEAETLANRYESCAFEEIHSSILSYLPSEPCDVLDIGAGSGRDAAWFAENGHRVVAIEPAERLMAQAKALHTDTRIQWISDHLPELGKINTQGLLFDVIWLSAVWMHVAPTHRERAFRKIVNLLRPGGIIMISLRYGPIPPGRVMYDVSQSEIAKLSRRLGVNLLATKAADDQLQRPEVSWESVILQLPDDGTGAFPLLRHIIANDAKSSTYKLGLIRSLLRISESTAGYVELDSEGNAILPLGLVALYWIRLYKPLVEHNIRQSPLTRSGKGLGFVKEAFRGLRNVSLYDLRVGMRFQDVDADHLRKALNDAAKTIQNMPAFYITLPNSSEPVFKVTSGKMPRKQDIVVDKVFLSQYGTLKVPAHIWQALSRYSVWIEPALLAEWVILMRSYNSKLQSFDSYHDIMCWLESEHDTRRVRQRVTELREKSIPIYCVWSGKKLKGEYAVDHCLPFARWPCNDLWNMMPTSRKVNQKKSDGLPSVNMFHHAHERILTWWDQAYQQSEDYCEIFRNEAKASLPSLNQQMNVSDLYEALLLQQTRLRQSQQLQEWDIK